MQSVITQSVVLPAPAERLFEMYLDPDDHAAFTGADATIGADAGPPFSAFGGVLSGVILCVVRRRLIVQTWRSTKFKADDPDSTLILSFAPDPDGGRIDLVHINVPDHDYDGVTAGWPTHYWNPWRDHLNGVRR